MEAFLKGDWKVTLLLSKNGRDAKGQPFGKLGFFCVKGGED